MGSQLELAINVVAALVVVLATTTVCGRVALLVGQPRVVGEMVAGVLLGPALFGALAPGLQAQLFPADVKDVLYVLSTIGLTFYMFLVGAALDHGVLDKPAVRRAAALATSGILPSFLLGAGAALLLFDQLAVAGSSRWELMLFLGGALSITSLPVLARILEERGVANTRVGGLVLVAAAIDDAVAWGILAVIVAVGAATGPTDALVTIGGAALFAGGMLTIGRSLLRRLGDRVERDGAVGRDTMTIVFLVVLGAGFLTDLIGVFSVFGGFVTGLAMPRSALLRHELETRLTDLNSILLLPVFFAFSGLNTEIDGFGSVGQLLLPLALILFVAMLGKYAGCGLTVRAQGFSWRYASAVGGLMSARGLMILIFINVGLSYGLITHRLFSILAIVAIVTTAAALPIYRASMPSWLEQAEKDVALGRVEVVRVAARTNRQ
ncbi:MAG TPA: cation:proton antiporter [Actinophytocola sp.]|nr:cation:proton antiporter [Actinophytocola sp.]